MLTFLPDFNSGCGRNHLTQFKSLRRSRSWAQSNAHILNGPDSGPSEDFVAVLIFKPLCQPVEITGTINADGRQNSIFSRFCIRKQ